MRLSHLAMMTQTSSLDPNTEKAKNLLQQGYVAYNNWEIRKARLLWRKAAVTDPANEEIWVALLNVTRDDEDRKICLQNILVLNPDNEEAEQRLRLLESETQPATAQDIEPEPEYFQPTISDNVVKGISWFLSGVLFLLVGIVLYSILIQLVV